MNACAEPTSHDPHAPHGADRLAKLADLRNQTRDLHDECSELTRDLDSIRRAVDRGLQSSLGFPPGQEPHA